MPIPISTGKLTMVSVVVRLAYKLDGPWAPSWNAHKYNHIDDCCEAHLVEEIGVRIL